MLGLGFTKTNENWPKEVTHARIWDIGATWKDIHVAPDQYNWARLDEVMAKMEGMGYKHITYVIAATPQWLAKYPTQAHFALWLGPGTNSMPHNVEEFNKFVHNLATRYKGRIHAYEIWNEPQLADFLYPYDIKELNTLATMTKRAYKTIKSIDSKALVLGASILPRPTSGGMKKAKKYLDAMKEKGYPVDAWTCHIYPVGNTNQGELWKQYFDETRAALKGRKTSKLWVTETGLGLLQGPISPEKTEKYLNKIKDVAKGTFVYWYAWDRPDLGGALIAEGTPAWNTIKKRWK